MRCKILLVRPSQLLGTNGPFEAGVMQGTCWRRMRMVSLAKYSLDS